MCQETNVFLHLSNQELCAYRSSPKMPVVMWMALVKLSGLQNEAKRYEFGKWIFKEDLQVARGERER